MAAYTTRMRPDFSSGGIKAPDLENTLIGFSDRMATQQAAEEAKKRQERLDKIAADERAEATRRWNITNARAEAQAARIKDEYDRKIKKETATNEAMQAILNPEYGKEAVVDAENAFKTGLANLTPEEQKIAIAEFEPAKKNVRDYMIELALKNKDADQATIFNTQSSLYDKRAKTPGTPEYEALEKAKLDLERKKQKISDSSWYRKQGYLKKLAEEKERKEAENNQKLLELFNTPTSTTEKVQVNEGQVVQNQKDIEKVEGANATFREVYTDQVGKTKNAISVYNNQMNDVLAEIKQVSGMPNSPEKHIKLSELHRKKAQYQNQIKNIEQNNIKIAETAAQEKYGMTSSLKNYSIPKVVEPVYKDKTTKKSKNEYIKELIDNAKKSGTVISPDALVEFVKTKYPKATKEELAAAKEKAEYNDVIEMIKNAGYKGDMPKTLSGANTLFKELTKSTDKNKSKNPIAEALSKLNANNLLYDDREEAIEYAKKLKKEGKYSDKQIAEAIRNGTDEDGDFKEALAKSYLNLM